MAGRRRNLQCARPGRGNELQDCYPQHRDLLARKELSSKRSSETHMRPAELNASPCQPTDYTSTALGVPNDWRSRMRSNPETLSLDCRAQRIEGRMNARHATGIFASKEITSSH